MTSFPLWSVIVCSLVFAIACERPVVAPRVPEIEIIEPSLNRLFFESPVVLKVRAASFRPIDRIERDGRLMTFIEEEDVWVDSLFLRSGVNEIQVAAIDVEEVEGVEMIQLASLRPRYLENAPPLPEPVGGHAATLLRDGGLLITGGAPRYDAEAVATAFLLSRFDDSFRVLDTQMDVGRVGHTATLLDDGRVLILGGSSTAALTNSTQLVETALLFDPGSQVFTEIPFNRLPLARAEHVTLVSIANNQLFIDVVGGLSADESVAANVLVARDDITTYALARDTLFFIGRSDGVAESFGLSSALLNPGQPLTEAKYLVSGSRFFDGGAENVNFTIDFNNLPVVVDIVDPHIEHRIQHAAVTLDTGLVLFIGGFQNSRSTLINSNEVYFEAINTFFRIEGQLAFRPRFSHTATKLISDRILVVGGFTFDGLAQRESQYLAWR